MNFPGGPICSSNRHVFSRRFYLFVEPTLICLIEQILVSVRFSQKSFILDLEHIRIFQKPLCIFSSNRYSFSRKPYLVIKHIFFSRRPLCLEQMGTFSRKVPPSNRYFVNRSVAALIQR